MAANWFQESRTTTAPKRRAWIPIVRPRVGDPSGIAIRGVTVTVTVTVSRDGDVADASRDAGGDVGPLPAGLRRGASSQQDPVQRLKIQRWFPPHKRERPHHAELTEALMALFESRDSVTQSLESRDSRATRRTV